MDSKTWLDHGTNELKKVGIDSARLDALILLEDELSVDRAIILAEPKPISSTELVSLNKKLGRRINHEPLSYIRQKTEFYGREFFMNQDVLEPRPESEAIIGLLIDIVNKPEQSYSRSIRRPKAEDSDREVNSQDQIIVDIGTGSGALAITAKLELPNTQVIAVDIDKKCLAVAKKNAKKLNANIEFIHGNLLEAIPSTIYHLPSTILLANLPYVPNKYKLNSSARFEPRLAIFGGEDGLDVYRKLFEQITLLPTKPNYVLTESLPSQHKKLIEIAKLSGYKQINTNDLIQIFKNTT